jgi:hypothetical protein
MKTNSQANLAGSTGIEDQNPLKTHQLTKTQETVNKLIQKHPKIISPKNPRGFPSIVTNSTIVGKPPYGLHQGSKLQAELIV